MTIVLNQDFGFFNLYKKGRELNWTQFVQMLKEIQAEIPNEGSRKIKNKEAKEIFQKWKEDNLITIVESFDYAEEWCRKNTNGSFAYNGAADDF